MTIAHGGLCHLRNQSLGVSQYHENVSGLPHIPPTEAGV
jgi:hypothetical protein